MQVQSCNMFLADFKFEAMMELTGYLRKIAEDINDEQTKHLLFLFKWADCSSTFESAFDVFRMFLHGGQLKTKQYILYDVTEVIGLDISQAKLVEYGIQQKEISLQDFSREYLFYRCLTQIALKMSSADTARLSSQFISTWHGIHYEDTTTALKLFCVLIRRKITGPSTQKMRILSDVMGLVSGVSKLRSFITDYNELTHASEPQRQYTPISIEYQSVLREVENVLRQNAVAERY